MQVAVSKIGGVGTGGSGEGQGVAPVAIVVVGRAEGFDCGIVGDTTFKSFDGYAVGIAEEG